MLHYFKIVRAYKYVNIVCFGLTGVLFLKPGTDTTSTSSNCNTWGWCPKKLIGCKAIYGFAFVWNSCSFVVCKSILFIEIMNLFYVHTTILPYNN